jgi:hypothetical protein
MQQESDIKNGERGFVTTIILIIIALVALKYAFHFDVIEYYKSAQVQGYVTLVKSWISQAYNWLDTTVGHAVNKK